MLGTLSCSWLINLSQVVEHEFSEGKSISQGRRSVGFRSKTGSGWSNQENHNPFSLCTNYGCQHGSDWGTFCGNKDIRNGDANGPGPEPGPRKGSFHDIDHNKPRDRGMHSLSYHELLECQQKGLCYECGGNFHSRHQCPDRQLRVMLIDDDDEEEGEVQVLTAKGEVDTKPKWEMGTEPRHKELAKKLS